MDLSTLGKLAIGVGAAFALVGGLLLLIARVPGFDRLGRLPGDIVIHRGPTTVVIPIVTSIILSIALTIALNLIFRR
ncbi:MAG: DUF2905 domain-containing protein [Thermomicrobiales bacterium]|nr:DUF2905 domain-containing protein [Thermomicrobiales bacterium]